MDLNDNNAEPVDNVDQTMDSGFSGTDTDTDDESLSPDTSPRNQLQSTSTQTPPMIRTNRLKTTNLIGPYFRQSPLDNVQSPDGIGTGPDHYGATQYPRLPPSPYEDWSYKMRRSMQEIVPNVFLGPLPAAAKTELNTLVEVGITHLICVRSPKEAHLVKPNFPNRFQYLIVEFEDKSIESIMSHFKTVSEFIDGALITDGKVLLYSLNGISKSPALAIAYIMNHYGVSISEAYGYVQSKRFCISPNDGFINQLREYEPIYRALHTVPKPLPTAQEFTYRPLVSKRPLSDDEVEDEEDGMSSKKVQVQEGDLVAVVDGDMMDQD